MRRLCAMGLWIVVACAACATIDVRRDFDRRVDFRTFETFRFGDAEVSGSDELVRESALVQQRIEAAVEEQLQAAGLVRRDADDVDLEVRIQAGSSTRHELEPAEYGSGYGPYVGPNYGPGPMDYRVRQVEQGVLVVDLHDARSGKLVWRAACRMSDNDLSDPELIAKAVGKAFEEYPP